MAPDARPKKPRDPNTSLPPRHEIDRIHTPGLPKIMYVFFGVVILVCGLVSFMALTGSSETAAGSPDGSDASEDSRSAPPRPKFGGREFKPGETGLGEFETFQDGKHVPKLIHGHIQSSFTRALHERLDEAESELRKVSDRDLDVLRTWQARAFRLGKDLRVQLEPIEAPGPSRDVRLQVSLDGENVDGVISVRKRGKAWIVVGAESE